MKINTFMKILGGMLCLTALTTASAITVQNKTSTPLTVKINPATGSANVTDVAPNGETSWNPEPYIFKNPATVYFKSSAEDFIACSSSKPGVAKVFDIGAEITVTINNLNHVDNCTSNSPAKKK